jgi:hypothetical protein
VGLRQGEGSEYVVREAFIVVRVLALVAVVMHIVLGQAAALLLTLCGAVALSMLPRAR